MRFRAPVTAKGVGKAKLAKDRVFHHLDAISSSKWKLSDMFEVKIYSCSIIRAK